MLTHRNGLPEQREIVASVGDRQPLVKGAGLTAGDVVVYHLKGGRQYLRLWVGPSDTGRPEWYEITPEQ